MLLDCSAVTDIEYTAVKMFIEAEEKLPSEGIVVSPNPQALAVVQHSKLGQVLGRERMMFSVGALVERYERLGAPTGTDRTSTPRGNEP